KEMKEGWARELAAMKAERDKASLQSLEVLDAEGNVRGRLRLPGELRVPNRTPCGDLCRYAMRVDGELECGASGGLPVEKARPQFLDASDQCAMFTYSSAEHAKEAQVRALIRQLELDSSSRPGVHGGSGQ